MQCLDLCPISVVSPQARAYSWVGRFLGVVVEAARTQHTATAIETSRFLGLEKAHRVACTKHARFQKLAYFLDAQSRCDTFMRGWRCRRVASNFALYVPLIGHSSAAFLRSLFAPRPHRWLLLLPLPPYIVFSELISTLNGTIKLQREQVRATRAQLFCLACDWKKRKLDEVPRDATD